FALISQSNARPPAHLAPDDDQVSGLDRRSLTKPSVLPDSVSPFPASRRRLIDNARRVQPACIETGGLQSPPSRCPSVSYSLRPSRRRVWLRSPPSGPPGRACIS